MADNASSVHFPTMRRNSDRSWESLANTPVVDVVVVEASVCFAPRIDMHMC